MASRFWVGGTGTWDASNTANWSATSGGAGGASVPSTADTVTFDANSGVGVCTTSSSPNTGAVTLNSSTMELSLGSNHVCTTTFTLTAGTLTLNSFIFTCNIFSSSNTNPRVINFGTGSLNVTGNNTTIYTTTTGTNFTYTGTPTVNFTYSGATGTRAINSTSTNPSINNAFNFNVTAGTDVVSFGAGARNVNNLDFTGFSGTCAELSKIIYGNLTLSTGMTTGAFTNTVTFASTSGTKTITTNGKTIDGPLTFNGIGGTWEFANTLTQGSTRAFTITNGIVKLKAGSTSTVGAFATSGSNQKYLQSTTAGSQATLSQASGTVTVSYLSIKDIAATGGATWNAYVDFNNVDQGGNTGWDFSYSPAIDNEFPVALRSFTQPKRF